MTERIREAFDAVHADEGLKRRTQEYLEEKVYRKNRRAMPPRAVVPALAACLLLVICLGGWRLYFTPTAVISVDINPSLELWINRFDKVVQVVGWNDDGRELAAALDIKYMDYDRALEQIMDSEKVSSLLSGDGGMTLAVVGDNESQCGRLLSGLRSCTAGQGNTYCYTASEEELEAAHNLGLSFGKYKVYQSRIELGSDIIPQEVIDRCMRELRDMIDGLSGGQSLPAGQGPLAPGKGQGSGQGKGPAWARDGEG